jgi:hypothetical protein
MKMFYCIADDSPCSARPVRVQRLPRFAIDRHAAEVPFV